MMNDGKSQGFDPRQYLGSGGTGRSVLEFKPGEVVFRQGDPAPALFYLKRGRVQISVISDQGKEGLTAIHNTGELFGHDSLVGERVYRTNAVAAGSSTIVKIGSDALLQTMKAEPTLAAMFMSFLLSRNVQIEDDLVDHLFNSSEKRLARLLLNLAGIAANGESRQSVGLIPKMSQELLASRIGTTRGRINYFMNRFRKMGHIDYNGAITVRASLAHVMSDECEAMSGAFNQRRLTA